MRIKYAEPSGTLAIFLSKRDLHQISKGKSALDMPRRRQISHIVDDKELEEVDTYPVLIRNPDLNDPSKRSEHYIQFISIRAEEDAFI